MPLKKPNAIITFSIVGIIVCVLLSVLFYRRGRSVTEILAAVGSVASLFGLVIAIVEILAVKKVTDATHSAVQQTKQN
jgi:Mn2+/Fe2+ NRAMP family transporter